MTLVNRSMNIRTLTIVAVPASAKCQAPLGMLAKANKFSRVLALQNSSKGDGMSKMRLENGKQFPLDRKRPNQPGTKPMFCASAVHSKAA